MEDVTNDRSLPNIKREGVEYGEFIGFSKFLKSQEYEPRNIDLCLAAVQAYAKEQDISLWSGKLFPRATSNKRMTNPWTRNKIEKFMLSLKHQKYRCMTALLFQGGLSLSDALQLEYGDIKEDFEANKVPLCICLTGSRFKEQHLTFVGLAGVNLLRNHLKSRGLIEPKDKIFHVKDRTVQEYFARMSKKNFGDYKKRNIYKPNSLRMAFYEFLWNEGCQESYIEYWMGYGFPSKLPVDLWSRFSVDNRELLRITNAKFERILSLDESILDGSTDKGPMNSASDLSLNQGKNFGQTMGLDYLSNLCNDIMVLLSDCNDICKFKRKERIFNFSDATPKNLATMNKIVNSEDDFSNFIKALWMIFYEGSGCLERVPEKFKQEDFIVLTVKYIRHWFFHDFGQEGGEEKKIERLSGKYQFLVGKENLHFLEPEGFQKLQLRILQDLKTFLENFKRYLNDN